MDEINESAIAKRLSELLTLSDDLHSQIEVLKNRLTMEQSTIDYQFKTMLHEYLQDVDTIVGSTRDAGEDIDHIRNKSTTIKNLFHENNMLFNNYSYVDQVSLAHRNMLKTIDIYKQFQKLEQDFARIDSLLQYYTKDQCNDLLLIHHYIFNLSRFLYGMSYQIKQSRSSKSMEQFLSKYFERLGKVSDLFEEKLWAKCGDIVPLVLGKSREDMMVVLKIVEVEEKEDVGTVKLREALASEKKGIRKTFLSTDQDRARFERAPKNYRSRFLKAIEEGVMKRFRDKIGQEKSLIVVLEIVDGFYFQDLGSIRNESRIFPQKYNMFDFFAAQYHQSVYKYIHEHSFGKLQPSEIVRLLEWVDEYDQKDARLNSSVSIKTDLLDHRKNYLVQRYLEQSSDSIQKWMINLLKIDADNFMQRLRDPEVDSNGKYVSDSSHMLFQIVDQTLEPAAKISRGKPLFDMVSAAYKSLMQFQNGLSKSMASGLKRYMASPSSVPEKIEDHTMVIGNNALRWIEHLDKMTTRIQGRIDKAFGPKIDGLSKQVAQGFLDMSGQCNTMLVDVIFAVIGPASHGLFTASWYNDSKSPTGMMLATVTDYLEEFSNVLFEFLFTRLISSIVERWVIMYITRIRSLSTKFQVQDGKGQTLQCLERDRRMAAECFSKYKSREKVETQLGVLKNLFPVFTGPKETLFLDLYSLRQSYSDISIGLLEDFLQVRDDMDRNSTRELLNQLEQRTKDHGSKNASIFSKIK